MSNRFQVATRKGLPRENACDLVFRHALDIDEPGERLDDQIAPAGRHRRQDVGAWFGQPAPGAGGTP